jgi:TolB-like protein
MPKVFVSYSRQDKKEVLEFVGLFRANGIDVWMDESSINASSVWAEQIVKAIDDCDLFVLFLSRSSVASENVSKELGYAGGTNKKILPVKIEDTEIPAAMLYHLNTIHFIEKKHVPPEKVLQHVLTALGDSVRQAIVPPEKKRSYLPLLAALGATVGAGLALFLYLPTAKRGAVSGSGDEQRPEADLPSIVPSTSQAIASSSPSQSSVVPGATSKQKVAILYFDDNTAAASELQPLSKGLALMLTGEASSYSGYQIVERADLQKVIDELDLAKTGRLDNSTTAQIGKLLGAQNIVVGSYMSLMGKFRVDARMIDVETGAVVRAASASGDPSAFDQLSRDLAGKLFSDNSEDLSGGRSTTGHSLPLEVASRLGEALQLADEGRPTEASAILDGLMDSHPDSDLLESAQALVSAKTDTRQE